MFRSVSGTAYHSFPLDVFKDGLIDQRAIHCKGCADLSIPHQKGLGVARLASWFNVRLVSTMTQKIWQTAQGIVRILGLERLSRIITQRIEFTAASVAPIHT